MLRSVAKLASAVGTARHELQMAGMRS
jgi:hypothetical protein